MAGLYHQLSGHEFEHASADGKGLGSLTCCSPWGHGELDITEKMNNKNKVISRESQFLLNQRMWPVELLFSHSVIFNSFETQLTVPESVAVSFSRGSSRPKDLTQVSCLAGGFFITEPPGKSGCGLAAVSGS